MTTVFEALGPGEAAAGCVRFRGKTGTLCLTPYAESIVHVAWFAGDPVPIPLWGIDAPPQPVPASTEWRTTDKGWRIELGGIGIELDAEAAGLRFSAPLSATEAFLTLRNMGLEPAEVSGEKTWHVGATFAADRNERFYGFGQHQLGWMDHGGQEVKLWHDYRAEGGEIIGVPTLISNRGYALLWDNASRTTCFPGREGETRWQSEVGEAVSFFVIGGDYAAIYKGIRRLTGATPLPPKKALGYIQCKQRYKKQDDVLDVARRYRAKGYGCDSMVVDWFHWKVLGDLDFDPEAWPDPAAMNAELRDLGFDCMISCWPRFKKESRYYDELEQRGWFMKQEDGTTLYGTETDKRGALIDTTNPECGRWYWDRVRDNYVGKGFTSYWLDECEPDICPHPYYLHAGTGARIHNVYPLTHTQAIYEGHRRDLATRCLILARSAYFGAQCNGTTFWSSDILPAWDVLRRQIPTGLNFCASGFAYWSSDIGGWQPLAEEAAKATFGGLLADEKEARQRRRCTAAEFPELYARWFQYGAFCPTFRAHGTRPENEVWSYGTDIEQILVTYLRLRYRLMPYLYALARHTTETGEPFMRGLFLDFPDDPNVADLADQYMFGPAFLVCPVVEQGATKRSVYFPAGCDWYDFWTGRKLAGGARECVDAPLDRLPLYVRAGSVVPMGPDVPHVDHAPDAPWDVRVYPGADGTFTLYEDEGNNYNYEQGRFAKTVLTWNDRDRTFSVEAPEGTFEGMQTQREFRVVDVSADGGTGVEPVGDNGVRLRAGGTAVLGGKQG